MFRIVALFLFAAVGEAIAKPTNVVLIMADDMGYEALSVNGSESCKSPNLDKLAAEGIQFTNGFSNPICTPSIVKIMTGQYNVRIRQIRAAGPWTNHLCSPTQSR